MSEARFNAASSVLEFRFTPITPASLSNDNRRFTVDLYSPPAEITSAMVKAGQKAMETTEYSAEFELKATQRG
jgi:hypothetical protein